MGKKVTKKAIRDNMRDFASFISCARAAVATIDGKEVDMMPFNCGAQAMAWYVQGILDGEARIDGNMASLSKMLSEVAFNELVSRYDTDGEKDEYETFAEWLRRIVEGFAKAKPHTEGGAEDDADAE